MSSRGSFPTAWRGSAEHSRNISTLGLTVGGQTPRLKVTDELLNGLVGLRMAAHERQELWRHGYHVRASLQRLVDVNHLTNAADNDFSPHVSLGKCVVNLL